MNVPLEALDAAMAAAVRALHDAGCDCGNGDHPASVRDLARLRTALEAAAPLMERPVFVIAVSHDLTDRDAANIQRAVAAALREACEDCGAEPGAPCGAPAGERCVFGK